MQGNRYDNNSRKQQLACQMYRDGATLDAIVKGIHLDWYRLRVALDREGLLAYPDEDKPADRCPCGKKTGVKGQKYCSWEHRVEYGSFRAKDPANYITFDCLNCGKEVTRLKKYSNHQKYCSNECSAKHNRTKQHIVVEDAVVLDSPYEAFFYGLMRLWKIPVERADRTLAVAVGDNGWYCPDFYLPDMDAWVETKGVAGPEDPPRWAAWREGGRRLALLGREDLKFLGLRANEGDLRRQLDFMATSESWTLASITKS
jgi:hypothetical protein